MSCSFPVFFSQQIILFQFLGVISYLLGLCNEVVIPANTKKSKKKTSQSPDQLELSEHLNKINDAVQDIIVFLEDVFDKWTEYDYTSTLQEELEKLDIKDYTCSVPQKLKNGLQEVLTDVKNILKKKSKYLKTLQ